jgi:hypothetical protein
VAEDPELEDAAADPLARLAALPRLLPKRVVALLNADERPETPEPAVDETCPVLLMLLVELEGRELDWML